jgi:signal transduction protein with GAF and PtsI domain
MHTNKELIMPENLSTIDGLNDKLATLMEIAALVNSNHSLELVVARAVQSACRLAGAETGSLMLLDGDDKDLCFEVVLGKQSEDLKKLRIPKGQGIGGWVVEHNTPVIVADVQGDARFYRIADENTHFVTHSMIAVPLQIKGKVIGVLQAINKQNGSFDHADLKLAIALANMVAPAIYESRRL